MTRSARGYTLIELAVSVAILGILATAMGSAIALAGRAVPSPDAPAAARHEAARVLDRIADEFRFASHLLETPLAGGRSLRFTVNDRDADGRPERIEYTWSGVPGDPLQRTCNGETADVAADVRSFKIIPQFQQARETFSGPVVLDDTEYVVSSYGVNPLATSPKEYKIELKDWIGQTFEVANRPARAVFWSPVEVSLMGRVDGYWLGDGADVQVFDADDAGLPTGNSHVSQRLEETAFSDSYTFKSVRFDTLPQLPAENVYCLVAEWDNTLFALSPAMRLRYEDSTSVGAANLLSTNDRHNDWELDDRRALVHEIKGKFWLREADRSIERTYLTSVEIEVETGNAGTPQRLIVTPPGAPEVLSAYWRTDFDANPRDADSNADGIDDWVARSGVVLSLNLADLIGGLLTWQGTLETRPGNDFNQPTTLDARFRSTGNSETAIEIHADAHNGVAAPIIVKLTKPGSTQTLRLYRKTNAFNEELLATVSGLPDDFARVRLLIDPADGRKTVTLSVNGDHVGTYRYQRYAIATPSDRFVSLVSESGSQWDWVEVRVGGESTWP